jgi:hypothetical protein
MIFDKKKEVRNISKANKCNAVNYNHHTDFATPSPEDKPIQYCRDEWHYFYEELASLSPIRVQSFASSKWCLDDHLDKFTIRGKQS